MRDDSEFVEQIFRIEHMKGELEELSDGQMLMGTGEGELTPDVEAQFLESVLAYERAKSVTHKELLARDGVVLPEPQTLTDDELALKLIEVIYAMAERRIFLENTNHLSDRQLYAHLYEDALNEWGPDLPTDNPMNCHLDIVGSGSESDVACYLQYYADEDTREQWAQEWPDMVIPAHTDPPYDRDRRLPKPSPPPDPFDDPEVVADWCASCREKLLRHLETNSISHGAISEKPLSYCPDLACVYAIDCPDIAGQAGWWAICGDLPTTYLPAAEIPDPRTFLRVVGQRWRGASDAMESGNPPADLTIGAPKDWPRLIPMLRRRADILQDWADDETAWEEEK